MGETLKEKIIIKYNHFKTLLTCQPFFVWHDIVGIAEEANDDELNFDLPSFIDEVEISFSEIQVRSFKILENSFNSHVLSSYDNVQKIEAKTRDEKIIKTKEALSNKNIDVILNPVFKFEYDKDYVCYSTPAFYDKNEKELSLLKLSPSTKLIDLLKVAFETMICEKNHLEIEKISLHILATEDYKRGGIDFYKTYFINTSKTSRSDRDAKEVLDYHQMQLAKSGQSNNNKGEPYEKKTLIELYREGFKPRGGEYFCFSPLEAYLERIILYQSQLSFGSPNESDKTMWGTNPKLNALIKETIPHYDGYNKSILKFEMLDLLEDEIIKKAPVMDFFFNNEPQEVAISDQEALLSFYRDLAFSEVVWYDFEAFSLPFCPLDGVLPFQQVVSQVSLIVTHKDEELSKLNLVIDPLNISLDKFVEIVTAIHKPGHKYVVYNAGYENTRLKEMATLLWKYRHPLHREIQQKVTEIIDNTYDLAKVFTCSAKKPAIVMISFLKGKHSIKLLEKYITEYMPNLKYKIKEYKYLNVKNGLQAMETANNRALGLIGEEVWASKVRDLQEYCENDVRAMIMVFKFIEQILVNHNLLY